MTEREMIELAARAYGMRIGDKDAEWFYSEHGTKGAGLYAAWVRGGGFWNPRKNGDDALRLAIALGLTVDCSRPSAGAPFKLHHFECEGFTDPYAATCFVITRAAAEIGRAMP